MARTDSHSFLAHCEFKKVYMPTDVTQMLGGDGGREGARQRERETETNPRTHACMHSCMHSFIHSCIPSVVLSFIHSLTHSHTHTHAHAQPRMHARKVQMQTRIMKSWIEPVHVFWQVVAEARKDVEEPPSMRSLLGQKCANAQPQNPFQKECNGTF